ncbi:MAG: hypothetical protein LBH96_04570 [Candidatus Peribacteria bacterium]|jgi:hypothetical protein|nr:hypothetical protein [Candidatus Peribacteria bacterium]
MTDTSPTQTTNAQEQTSKKNFFGGEINFQDKNTFETLDTPAEEISEHSETTDYENILQSTSQPQTTEEPSFVDFDPFGDDEESEMVIEPTIEPDPQPAPTEQPENQSKEDSQPENDFSPNEMESSLKEEILQQKKNSTEATSDEEIFEQEPESTGDEIIDKFLELSTTARKIFQLSEDKSHFKIL